MALSTDDRWDEVTTMRSSPTNLTEARLVEVSTSPGTANDMAITPLGTPTSE